MKKPAQSFEDLIVWQKAHQFVLDIYRYTQQFPKTEQYGSMSQLRRAAVSVPANIAEGFRKRGLSDKVRFYNIAEGSLEESKYYLILSKDLNYGNPTRLLNDLNEVAKLLSAYGKAIKKVGRDK